MKRWLTLLGIYLALALACQGGWIGSDWAEQHDLLENIPPSARAWLGTDHLGRSLSANLLQGCRLALGLGSLSALLGVLLGTLLGALAGWKQGTVDAVCLWIAGVSTAIPGLLLALLLAFVLGHGFWTLCLAIGFSSWVGIFRLVRAEVLRLQNQSFVGAAQSFGASPWFVFRRHFLPHLKPMLAVQFGLLFVFAVQAEVILSFLGVGIDSMPSWGRMIADAWAWDDLGFGNYWRMGSATLAMAGLVLAVQQICEISLPQKENRT